MFLKNRRSLSFARSRRQALFLPFRDMNAQGWYAPDVASPYDKGMTLGVSEAEFSPEEIASRAETAAMLKRFIGGFQEA